MNLVMLSGCFFSVEQPGSSVMFYLDVFKRMVFRGCMITKMCFCALGSPFKNRQSGFTTRRGFIALNSPAPVPLGINILSWKDRSPGILLRSFAICADHLLRKCTAVVPG